KQKTAYEITTGDWSSDVCSSDLLPVIRFVFLHDPGHVHHQIARRHVHDLHALGVAARNADALDRHADHDPLLGDHHQLVVGEHLFEGDDVARLVRTLQGDD